MVFTKGTVMATVTLVKWNKTQELIRELKALLDKPKLPHKQLEQIRGFLVYVARTFPWMTPYLKGLHGTLDGWQPGRDANA